MEVVDELPKRIRVGKFAEFKRVFDNNPFALTLSPQLSVASDSPVRISNTDMRPLDMPAISRMSATAIEYGVLGHGMVSVSVSDGMDQMCTLEGPSSVEWPAGSSQQ